MGKGGFDHAAVFATESRLFVAHTANDTLEVINTYSDQFLWSLDGFPGVAGVLADDRNHMVYASNRGAGTLGVFSTSAQDAIGQISVGPRPNGLAVDPARRLVAAACVGAPESGAEPCITFVSLDSRSVRGRVSAPGRTRWASYDLFDDRFYVNIADPAVVVWLDAAGPCAIDDAFPVPARGPHGLDLDIVGRALFCACDEGVLLRLALPSGEVSGEAQLAGSPDVIFVNPLRRVVYVACGNSATLEVFDAQTMRRLQRIETEPGAHTLGFDARRQKVYALCPESCSARVYIEA